MFGITKDLIEPRDTNSAHWSQDFLDAVLLGSGALAAQRGGGSKQRRWAWPEPGLDLRGVFCMTC